MIIDLTEPLRSGMRVYPGDPEVKISLVHTYEENTWQLRKLEMGSHSGTHVDVFSHMHEGSETLDEIPLERFMGDGQVVGLDDHWPEQTGLFFIEEADVNLLDRIREHNPGFVGGNITEALERALLGQGIITYTRLVNLDLIPGGKQFMFYGFPLRIVEGDGSPVRAVAIIE